MKLSTEKKSTETTSCYECARFAEINNHAPPIVDASEINQETGLCWEVCDMERENAEIEADEDSYYAEDY
tara:strand:- start:32325 stop:32534 length:210 start_codon:yes stop_codon:yes gene_type:complete